MNKVAIGDAELRVLKKLVSARGNFVRLTAKEQTALNQLERRLMMFDKVEG